MGTPVSDPLQKNGTQIQVMVLDALWHWAPPAKCGAIREGPVWIEAAAMMHFELRVACPAGYEPEKSFVARLKREKGGLLTHDAIAAVRGADVIYTDTWTSMGQESDGRDRHTPFRPYQVNIERYRYRGARIPTPWSSAPTTGSPAPAA